MNRKNSLCLPKVISPRDEVAIEAAPISPTKNKLKAKIKTWYTYV